MIRSQGCRVLLVLCFALLVVAGVSGQGKRTGKRIGYTVMAGGLGRVPRQDTEIWPNTEKAHLEFCARARLNLVVVEIPYGVNKRHPKSATTARFIKKLKEKKLEVWIIYPHVLAQHFDLPRQVDGKGKKISWKCCLCNPQVQAWMVENGKALCETYKPAGLCLFGTFQVGGKCHCPACKKLKPSQLQKNQELFFLRLKKAIGGKKGRVKLGTCSFWTKPSKKTVATLDLLTPVVPIFQPGYNGPGQVKKKVVTLKRKYKKLRVVPYIKIFLASQTRSNTADILTAVRESMKFSDGFFFWGYNPGHVYKGQDYAHPRIEAALRQLKR